MEEKEVPTITQLFTRGTIIAQGERVAQPDAETYIFPRMRVILYDGEYFICWANEIIARADERDLALAGADLTYGEGVVPSMRRRLALAA